MKKILIILFCGISMLGCLNKTNIFTNDKVLLQVFHYTYTYNDQNLPEIVVVYDSLGRSINNMRLNGIEESIYSYEVDGTVWVSRFYISNGNRRLNELERYNDKYEWQVTFYPNGDTLAAREIKYDDFNNIIYHYTKFPDAEIHEVNYSRYNSENQTVYRKRVDLDNNTTVVYEYFYDKDNLLSYITEDGIVSKEIYSYEYSQDTLITYTHIDGKLLSVQKSLQNDNLKLELEYDHNFNLLSEDRTEIIGDSTIHTSIHSEIESKDRQVVVRGKEVLSESYYSDDFYTKTKTLYNENGDIIREIKIILEEKQK